VGVILSRAKDLNTSLLPNTNPLTNKPIEILHSAGFIQDDKKYVLAQKIFSIRKKNQKKSTFMQS